MNELTVFKSKNELADSLSSLFKDYDLSKKRILEIADFVKNKSEVLPYFLSGNKISNQYANLLFDQKGAISSLNAEYWTKVMSMTDVLSCMTAEKRNQWSEMIQKMETPDFEHTTVVSTIYNLLQSRGSFFADKVDGVFQKLSKNHVTNSPAGFKQRMILEHLVGSFELINHKTIEYIDDLRAVIAKIMKRDGGSPRSYSQISDLVRDNLYGSWHTFDGGSFKIRIYKKGTAHIEIDENMAVELNAILSQKYPMAIPEKNRTSTKRTPKQKEFSLEMEILSVEACIKLADIADSVASGRSFVVYDTNLSQRVKEEINKALDHLQVDRSANVLSFNYDASGALKEMSRTGLFPDKKSHQFYPTTEFLAKKIYNNLNITGFDSILEPSAGLGGIATYLPKRQTVCVEISKVNCEALKSMGFKQVICQDFLKYSPIEKFDKIAMNPPFTKNQAEMHLLHAISLLTDDGRLSAILPASYKGKKFDDKKDHHYSEIFESQFEDTQVRVVILTLKKKKI